MKYHIFCLYNNDLILKHNLVKSLDSIQYNGVIEHHYYNNVKNKYNNIRDWINEVFDYIYRNSNLFKNTRIVFAHQDVIIDKNFFSKLDNYTNSKTSKFSMMGFAGIDNKGRTHTFMKDSQYFTFSGTTQVLEVESVDEYFFVLETNILLNESIKLSNIGGWHAYSVELSIVLRRLGYSTVYVPLYTFHNSNRTNNNGLFDTHEKLLKIYETEIRTMCGNIQRISKLKRLKRTLYLQYSKNIKFNSALQFSEFIKYILLDLLRIRLNVNRYIFYKKSDRNNIMYVFVGKLLDNELEIKLDNGRNLHFRTINHKNITKLLNDCYNEDTILYIKGLRSKIKESNQYIAKNDLNIIY